MKMMEKVERVNSEKWSDEWIRLLRVLLYLYYKYSFTAREYLWGQLTKAKQAIRKDDSSLHFHQIVHIEPALYQVLRTDTSYALSFLSFILFIHTYI